MEIHDSRVKEKEKPLITSTGGLKQPQLKIHDSRNKFEKPTFKLILFYQNNRKKIKWFIFSLFILFIIFFPVVSGNLIGNWIKDFIGTILNIIKTI